MSDLTRAHTLAHRAARAAEADKVAATGGNSSSTIVPNFSLGALDLLSPRPSSNFAPSRTGSSSRVGSRIATEDTKHEKTSDEENEEASR
jgi:hypothetical protein